MEVNKDFFSERAVYLHNTDVFLISFMKCGRTCLRFMIGQLIERKFGIDNDDKLVYTDCVKFPDYDIPVIKAYHDDNPHLKKPGDLQSSKSEFQTHKVIFLVRNSRDVAVALFYHMKYRSKQYDGDIDDFVIEIIPTIVRYFNIWLDNKDLVQELLIVKYEELHLNGIDTLRRINNFLGFEKASDAFLKSIIDVSSLDKMKVYESNNESWNA